MHALVIAHVGQPINNLWDGLVHPLTGADHLLAMASIGIIAALAKSKRVAWLTPIAFVTAMVIGGGLGMLGLTIPAVDSFIAASVLICGALLLIGSERIAVGLPVIAAAFGFVHGVAHGAEAPAAAQPVAYVLGFVVATVALHTAGASAGWVMRRHDQLRIAAGTVVSGAGLALLVAV
jgi:urease accessory protein